MSDLDVRLAVAVIGRNVVIDFGTHEAAMAGIERVRVLPTPAGHEPGDHHQYEIECKVCGQFGMIRVTLDPERAE